MIRNFFSFTTDANVGNPAYIKDMVDCFNVFLKFRLNTIGPTHIAFRTRDFFMKPPGMVTIFKIAFFIISVIVAAKGDSVTVSEFYATIRALPHGDANRLGIAKKAEVFKVLSHEGAWYHIEYKNLPAWVNERYVTRTVSHAPVPSVAVSETLTAHKSAPVVFKPAAASGAEPNQQPQGHKPSGIASGRNKAFSVTSQPKSGKASGPEKPSVPASRPLTEPSVQPASPRPDAAPAKQEMEENGESPSLLPLIIILIVLGIGLVLSFYIYFAKLDIFRKRGHKNRSAHHKIESVIIGRTEKRIHNSLTNANTALAHYLADLGCKVHHFTEVSNAKTFLERYVPNVVVVDWQLEDNVQSSIESIFRNSKLGLETVVVFYNVADPTVKTRSNNAGISMEYLGISVSDQDLSKIISPLLREGRKEKRFTESVQTSALEGEIQRGSLSEVLQFIEMGRKTGCLYLTGNNPLGLIYFEQGRIYYAATPANQGIEAVVELLDLDNGHFHFVLDKQSDSRNINSSTLEIVMEWTRRRDEAGKV